MSNLHRLNHILALLGAGFTAGALVTYLATLSKRPRAPKSRQFYVGVELGGTNYSVAIAEADYNRNNDITDFRITKRKSGNTYTSPQESLTEIITFIAQNKPIVQGKTQEYDFIGIASFGPLCLQAGNTYYGTITTTPKEAWRGMPVLKRIQQPFPEVRVGIDTDVNAAAYAEFKIGGHKITESLAYVTVGTGVGVGVVAQGKTVHGLTHPEGGHIVVQRSPMEFQGFEPVCPFHKKQTCLEGMVCNKSIAERLKVNFTALAQIPDDSKVWQLVGHYLAQLCLNITLLISPQVIVVGGGIMNRKLLYPIIRSQFKILLAGYVQHQMLGRRLDEYIVEPGLKTDAGVKGAMMLSTLHP